MLTKILHSFVANPWVYEQVRRLAGSRHIDRRLATHIAPLRAASLVLDVGEGTGVLRALWLPTCTYVCLDIDRLKLQSFLKKCPGGNALLCDASQAPLRNGSVDVVLRTLVSHHVPDEMLARLIRESVRLLKDGGVFIFLDAVWDPTRLLGRLLWRFDRGAYPRTERR